MMDKETFEKSLKNPFRFWSKKSLSDVRVLLGNETAQMVGFDQYNPHHCYDLFMHTLHTVNNLDCASSTTLRVAAFFHDIGKPFVAHVKQGRLVFYGHAKKSAEIAKSILKDLGYTQVESDIICFYISHHDDFISWVLPTEPCDRENPYLIEITSDNIATHIRKIMDENKALTIDSTYELWANLLHLCRADAASQSELVYSGGVVVDSKKHKLKKVGAVETALKDAFVSAEKPFYNAIHGERSIGK